MKKTTKRNRIQILFLFIISLSLNVNAQKPNSNCKNCNTFTNADLYSTLISNSLAQVSPDDCSTFQLCFPVISESCDIVARINWGDGSPEEELDSIAGNPGDITDCIQHTYSSTTPSTISISIVLNGVTCSSTSNLNVPFDKNCDLNCDTCESNPLIISQLNKDCTLDYTALIELSDCVQNVTYSWVFSNGDSSNLINPTTTPTQNGVFTATLLLSYTLENGVNCSLKASNKTDITCVEENTCGICTDTVGDFPVISDVYNTNNNTVINGKTITSDCNGNIYSLGNWNGAIMLNKYDLSGNLLWSQNTNFDIQNSFKNIIMEVDENESIYIKYNTSISKYNSNGTLSWEIIINNSFLNRNNFTINKQTGDIYLPINTGITLSNITTGNNNTFNLLNGFSNILKINTNSNITNLGAFPSSGGILNLHYNNGLKSWSRNSTNIEFRKYSPDFDVLDNANTTWINNSNGLSPLFYNHINNEVYVYNGNPSASNNNNTRILSIDSQGNVTADILLPEALYISQHKNRNHATYAFNDNNGELAVYADQTYNNGNSSIISTIDTNYQLDTKNIVSPPTTLLSTNPFYSRSFHAITYGGDCLYFYGQYISEDNVILDGGLTLPPSGGNNTTRSVILRLQDDLEIKSLALKKESIMNSVSVYPNPFIDTINFKNNSEFIIKKIEIYNSTGRMVANKQNEGTMIVNGKSGMYFVKIYFENEKTQTLSLIKK